MWRANLRLDSSNSTRGTYVLNKAKGLGFRILLIGL